MPLKNTIKPTIRHLLRDKSYLVVSVLSLSVGLTCCLFIFKYVQDELSYDRFHEDAERIFRIEREEIAEDGSALRHAFLHPDVSRVASELYPLIPEIELETRLMVTAGISVDVNGEIFADRVLAADSTFFKFFSFNLIEGNPQTVLKNPNSVIIARSTAEKYFGTSEVMGKNIGIRFWQESWEYEETLLTITGIAEDVPSNSHFPFDLVRSVPDAEHFSPNNYTSYLYIRVDENVSADELEEKMNDLYREHVPEDLASASRFLIQPMTAIHLHSSANGELSANSDITYVYLFTIIAFIILGIACVNFATLATSRSIKRVREIGMRKVFGAENSSLRAAFLLESLLLSFTGLCLAYFFAWHLLPYFNLLAGKEFLLPELISPSFLLWMAGITVITGIAAGLYPAVFMTGQKPASLLGKDITKGERGGLLWKSMVVIQLTISMALIGAVYIIHQQISFIHQKDLGFNKEGIITFFNHFGDQAETFLDQLNQHPNIEQTAGSGNIPGIRKMRGMYSIEVEGRSEPVTFDVSVAGHQFFDMYDISITQGRNFSDQLSSDFSEAFIINETAAEMLGWTEPLGKRINAFGRNGYVIGVIEDFHFLSLHNEILPMIFLMYDRPNVWLSVKISSGQQLSETLSFIEDRWKEFLPGVVFSYNFVDEQFARAYDSEQRARSLLFSFSVLAVIIAILGLFSFASYTMQQKNREIGIRKVLGASVYDILKLFYSGYVRLLIVSACIALPAGFIWMRSWFQNFSYKTEIGPDAFAVPLILALIILMVSVSYQALKGARRNPAETIRIE